MSRRLLISALPGETRAAWLDPRGRLVDLIVLRDDKPQLADNLYLGRVAALDRGLEAAFVDIGLARPGLLPLAEATPGLSEGDAVVVRVRRAPQGDKGAKLAAQRLDAALRAQLGRLRPPALLRAARDPIAAALAAATAPAEIVIDDPDTFARAGTELSRRPELRDRLRLDRDAVPLFERAGVEAQIEALLEPAVPLPGGGHLLIEPVRTLTAIDVNSGAAAARGGPAALARAVDLEAAAEIPRQLRLRALSGLIVIDFLALAEAAARKRVVATLEQGLAMEPRGARVFAMRRSGLVEMTRRRAGPALHELLTEPCGIGGTGRVRDPVTEAFAALRALRRQAAAQPGGRPALAAPPRVLAALQGPAAAARAALEARLGFKVETYPREEGPREDGPREDGAAFEIVPGSC